MRRLPRILLNAATVALVLLCAAVGLARITGTRFESGPWNGVSLDGDGVHAYWMVLSDLVSGVSVPLWAILTLTSAAMVLRRITGSRGVRLGRRNDGLCPTCNYDLRATPDRCPECGTTPEGR